MKSIKLDKSFVKLGKMYESIAKANQGKQTKNNKETGKETRKPKK